MNFQGNEMIKGKSMLVGDGLEGEMRTYFRNEVLNNNATEKSERETVGGGGE